MGLLSSIAGGILGKAVGGLFGGSSSKDKGPSTAERVASAASPYFSSALSYQGGQNANAANMSIAAANNAQSYKMFKEANKFSAKQAKIGRNWSRKMSNTAIRRQMRDMRLAGINPILAGRYGGASVGSAATAGSVGVPSLQQATMQDVLTPAVNSGLSAKQTESNVGYQSSQINKMEYEIEKMSAEIGLTDEQTENAILIGDKLYQEIENLVAQKANIESSTRLNNASTGVKLNIKDVTDVGTGFINNLDAAGAASQLGTEFKVGVQGALKAAKSLPGWSTQAGKWLLDSINNLIKKHPDYHGE